MTSLWYSTVLSNLQPSSSLLDIGVGNASSLLSSSNARVISSKRLQVYGVDYTQSYVNSAQENINKANLSKSIKVVYGSVYDTKLLKSLLPNPR